MDDKTPKKWTCKYWPVQYSSWIPHVWTPVSVLRCWHKKDANAACSESRHVHHVLQEFQCWCPLAACRRMGNYTPNRHTTCHGLSWKDCEIWGVAFGPRVHFQGTNRILRRFGIFVEAKQQKPAARPEISEMGSPLIQHLSKQCVQAGARHDDKKRLPRSVHSPSLSDLAACWA